MSNVAGKIHQCPHCGRPRGYAYFADAFYCGNCDLWLSEPCEQPDCIFCEKRRERPSGHNLCKPKDPS